MINYFDLDTPIALLQNFLQEKNWLSSPTEHILAVEKPGAGNMNVVLRVKTNERSFILKQSRPFVQKYQQIEAPLDRIDVEYRFYQNVQQEALAQQLPKILAYDKQEYLMMMEDLGQCEDMTSVYQERRIPPENIAILTNFLSVIHQQKAPDKYPENLSLRQLNHQHIFVLPFLENNGFQLDEVQTGLQAVSMAYKKEEGLKMIIDKIGQQYLSAGNTLIHGDYYPGSWMQANEQLYVIDPEFSFLGFPEFDLGVMAAHLLMATSNMEIPQVIFQQYKGPLDQQLSQQITGIEIMRRLIGLAQLPLERSLEEKVDLLQAARKMILA